MKTGMFKKFFRIVKSIFIDSHKNLDSTKSVVIVAGRGIITIATQIAFFCTHKLNDSIKECLAYISVIIGLIWAFH